MAHITYLVAPLCAGGAYHTQTYESITPNAQCRMMEPEHTTPLHTYPITLDEIDPQHLKPCKGGEFSIELHSKIIVSGVSQHDDCCH